MCNRNISLPLSCNMFYFAVCRLKVQIQLYFFSSKSRTQILKLPADNMYSSTDYGRPMKPFFIEIPNFRAWADNLGRQILEYLEYFR